MVTKEGVNGIQFVQAKQMNNMLAMSQMLPTNLFQQY